MKKVIKVLPWFIIAILVIILVLSVQKACAPGRAENIKAALQNELEPLKKAIAAAKERQEAMLNGQKALQESNTEMLQKVADNQKTISEMKKDLAKRPAPENPADFKSLPECREKYKVLEESYILCLKLNEKKDESLNLFYQVKENLLDQITLLQGAVEELKGQVKNYSQVEQITSETLEKLDKAYRAKRFWTGVRNVGIGAVIGAGAIAILKAIK